jgi:hypothetical protein
VDTCGSLFDTAVAVYCSPCPVTPASQIACNNDNGPSCPGTSASVQFPAVAGTAYWIRIGGNAAGVVGAGDLTIAPVSTGVPNDACSAASPIGLGVYNGTTIGATPTAGLVGMCGASNATRDVWYIFTAPCTAGVVTLHTCTLPACSSTYDTVLSVHSACPSSSSNNAIVCNDDAGGPCGLRSRVSFTPVPCRQYLVRVSGFAGQSGNFVLTATQASVAPPNNNCAAATVIAGGSGTTTVNFTTCGASNDGPNQCVPWSRDIWYRWTAPCSGPVTMDTFGSGFDTVLSAYPGAPCPPTATSQIACNDDAMFTLQSQITFPAVAGTSYLIRLSGFGNSSGCGVLHIISPPAACPGCPPSLSTPVPGSVFTLSGPVFGPTVTGKWRVRVNCCMCFENCNFTATGVSTIPQLVAALVADINARVASAGCPASSLVATQPGGGANLVLKHRCPGGGALSFSVGAAATPCTGLCTIVGNNFFTNQPCQFNPFVEGLVDDLDGNGIPDTCTGGARGACCSGAVGCTVTTQGDCPAPGSFNLGVSCAPDSDPCGKGLPCAADYNQSGAVTVQDIFDFLAGYFSGDPAADFNGVGGLSVQDIVDFLAAYFTGCP